MALYQEVDMNLEEYMREVLAHSVALSSEDSTILDDLHADGFVAECRRTAIDGAISRLYDEPLRNFLDAMRTVDISAQKAAEVMTVLALKFERKKKK